MADHATPLSPRADTSREPAPPPPTTGTARQRHRRHRGGRGGYEPQARVVERANRVFQLSTKGRTQREIALELGISQAAVSKILRRELDRRTAKLPQEWLRLRARHYARYEYLYRLCHDGYDQSCAALHHREQRHTTRGTGSAHDSRTVSASERSGRGEPRYLGEMRRTLRDQQRLFEGHFNWRELAMLLTQDDDGRVTVNEELLSAEDRELLRRLRARQKKN